MPEAPTTPKKFTAKTDFHQAARADRYQFHDYYLVDDKLG